MPLIETGKYVYMYDYNDGTCAPYDRCGLVFEDLNALKYCVIYDHFMGETRGEWTGDDESGKIEIYSNWRGVSSHQWDEKSEWVEYHRVPVYQYKL